MEGENGAPRQVAAACQVEALCLRCTAPLTTTAVPLSPEGSWRWTLDCGGEAL